MSVQKDRRLATQMVLGSCRGQNRWAGRILKWLSLRFWLQQTDNRRRDQPSGRAWATGVLRAG